MSLFKNDKFGLKQWRFRRKVDKALRDSVLICCGSIQLSMRVVREIGVPTNDDEVKMLQEAVRRYDEAVAELESHVKYARLCIEEVEDA